MRAKERNERRVNGLIDQLACADGRRALAAEFEGVLFTHVLDAHWPATRDATHGGFLTDMDRRWRPSGAHDKSLDFQARQTWTFARAARLHPGRGYDEAARAGFAFLTDVMWDGEHGGFYTLVDRRGRALRDGSKHPHGHTYAIEAFLELEPLIGKATSRAWAKRSFDWLETVAWDRESGGYWGEYRRDNTRIEADATLPATQFDWIGTPYGLKDLNVAGDALGAVTSLARVTGTRRARDKLALVYRQHVEHHATESGLMSYFYQRDWTPVPDVPRAGHPLQRIECLFSAAKLLGRADEALDIAERIARRSLRFFAHPKGGFMFARSPTEYRLMGVDLTVPFRVWWIQTEAARAFLLLALERDDPFFREAFARQWAFIERAMVDRTHRGLFDSAEQGALARRHPTRPRMYGRKTNIWKDASHDGNFLMDTAGWLRAAA